MSRKIEIYIINKKKQHALYICNKILLELLITQLKNQRRRAEKSNSRYIDGQVQGKIEQIEEEKKERKKRGITESKIRQSLCVERVVSRFRSARKPKFSRRIAVFMENVFISQPGINYGIYLRASIFVSEAKRKTPVNLCPASPARAHIRAAN